MSGTEQLRLDGFLGPLERIGDFIDAFFLDKMHGGHLLVRFFQSINFFFDLPDFFIRLADFIRRRRLVGNPLEILIAELYTLLISTFQIILGLVGGDPGQPGFQIGLAAAVQVEISGEKGVLGQVLRFLIILNQLMADGENQFFVAQDNLPELFICSFQLLLTTSRITLTTI